MTRREVAWDRIGTWASSLCAVHCALSGFALGLLGTLGLGVIASGPVEIAFFATALFAGVFAVFSGYRKHRQVWPGMLFLAGLGFILFRHLQEYWMHGGHAHEHHHHHPETTWMSILGGLLLVSFHIANLRLSHRATCPCCSTG